MKCLLRSKAVGRKWGDFWREQNEREWGRGGIIKGQGLEDIYENGTEGM